MTSVLRQLMEKHWEYDSPMYLAFLDLENAFDRVGLQRKKKLWDAMDEYEIPSELKRASISTYGTCQSKVRVGAGEGYWSQTRKHYVPPTIHHVHGLGYQRSRHNQRTSQLHTGILLMILY